MSTKVLILKVPCGTLYVLKTAQNYGIMKKYRGSLS